ncbi:major facilitator superfamily domain-containing protein 6-like [Amphiura filiformis]|uniref:major facilitator superfamily domain-containing protein 6-like n=1 Tax=Amphiura filiformis TaxID=82378 RepID=UPI003B221DF3
MKANNLDEDTHARNTSFKDNASKQRVWKDIFSIDRSMLTYKIFYSCVNGAFSCIISFLPLQMKQLGLSPSRIGLASASRPFLGTLSTAMIGLISDRIGYRRAFLLGLMILMLFSGIMLALIKSPDEASCDEILESNNSNGGSYKRDTRISGQYANVADVEGKVDLTSGVSIKTTGGKDYVCCDIDDLYVIKRNIDLEGNNGTRGVPSNHALVINRSWQYEERFLFHTFITVLVIGSLFETFFRPTDAITDAATMGALADGNKGLKEYGSQRCWANLFFDFGAIVSGTLLTYTREDITKCGVKLVNADYKIILVPFCALMIGGVICIRWFQSSNRETEPPQWKQLKILLTPHHIIILSLFLFFGIFNGVVWGFLYWHLENLGATHGLLSAVILFQAASEIPSGYLCRISIEYLGYWNSIHLGFLIYTVRFVWIYYIENPWWSIPVEIFQGFAFSQTWSVLLAYMNTFVPANLSATVCGICSALYFSLGVSLGYLLTGFMVETVGGSATFGYYALVSLGFSMLFALSIRMVKTPNPATDELDAKTKTHKESASEHGQEEVLLPKCPVELTTVNQQPPPYQDNREANN